MAEDIMIEVAANLEKALADFKKLEQQIKTTKASVDKELEPAFENTSTRIQNMGGRISGAGQRIKNSISGETALAFTALSAGVTSFTKGCVDSAIASESAWSRFGALVNQNGGNWKQQSKDIKDWATTFSSEMGYAVSDTREASMNFLQLGLSVDQTKQAMYATAGVAARTGMTEAEASNVVTQALLGKGRQLEKMTGLRIDDYKTADGQIDRERLLKDLYNGNIEAIREHGKTTEAQMARINNAWGKFKTGIGQALLPVITMIADFVEKLVTGFNSIEGPMKPIIAGFIALTAVVSGVIGVLGIIAPILINVGTLVSKVGKWYGKLKVAKGVGESWTNFKNKINSVKNAITGLKIGDKVKAIKTAVLNSWNLLKTNIDKVRTAITKMELSEKRATLTRKAHTIATKIWSGVTKTATMVQKALNFVMNSNPIFLVITAIIALVGVLIYLYQNNEQVRNTINALGDYLKGVFLPVWDALCDTFNAVVNWFKEVFSGSKSLTEALGDVLGLILKFTGLGAIVEVISRIGEAVGPAAQQIWDSFVNALSGLGEWLWNTLADIPRIIGEALSNLGGSIVQGGGLLEGIMTIFAPIPMLIFGALQRIAPLVLPVLQQLITTIIDNFMMIGQGILNAFLNIPTMILQAFSNIIMNIQTWFTQAGATVGILIQMLVQTVTMQFWQLVGNVGQIFNNILMTIWTALSNIGLVAGNLAGMIRTAIVTKWNQLIGNAGTIFTSILNTIRNKLMQIVTNAKNKAKELVDGYVKKVQELPGKVGTEIANLATTIKNKLVEAGKRAFEGAKELVAQFLAGMGIHSPGYIQRATRAEMSTLPVIIGNNGLLAVKATRDMARGIVGAWSDNMETLRIDEIEGLNVMNRVNDELNKLKLNTGLNFTMNRVTEPVPSISMHPVTSAIQTIPLNNNNTSNNEGTPHDPERTVIVENLNMNLELGNLNEEQSKKVVFTALKDIGAL